MKCADAMIKMFKIFHRGRLSISLSAWDIEQKISYVVDMGTTP
jgi:hypothetical protein